MSTTEKTDGELAAEALNLRGLVTKEGRVKALAAAALLLTPHLRQTSKTGEFTASRRFSELLEQIRVEQSTHE